MKRIVFYLACIALSACLLSCSNPGKTPLPSELLGTWSYGHGSGYYEYTASYTFRAYDYDFSETAPSMGVYNEGYTEDVEEVYLSESMFRTPDDMYIWWHIEGNLCYWSKTNPGATKPLLAANWWVGASTMTKQ